MRRKNILNVLLGVLFGWAVIGSLGSAEGSVPAPMTHALMAAQQGQGEGENRQDQQPQSDKQSLRMDGHILAGDLIGLDIYNDRGVELGTLRDIVLDREHTQVAYVALARGGFLGIGEDLYPIPWEQVTPQFAENRAVVPIEERVLENAEPLDERSAEMRRISELTGMSVHLADAGPAAGQPPEQEQSLQERLSRTEGAGELEDVLINSEGQPVFALIRPNTEELPQLREYHVLAVPWVRIQVMPEDEQLLADITRSEAEQLAVSQYELTRLDDPAFAQQLFTAVGEPMPGVEQPAGPQPMQQEGRPELSEQMRKWSDFTQQCLGPDMDRATMIVEGTVDNVGTLYTSPEAEAPDGLRFIVTTPDKEQVMVYAGPRGDVSQQLNLFRGDRVLIRGAGCQIENEQVFVATSIRTDGDEYELHQRNGAPQWESRRQAEQNPEPDPRR